MLVNILIHRYKASTFVTLDSLVSGLLVHYTIVRVVPDIASSGVVVNNDNREVIGGFAEDNMLIVSILVICLFMALSFTMIKQPL